MELNCGNTGKILEVNLDSRTFATMEPEEEIYRMYLGGTGLAARLMFDMKCWEFDPLSPENPLFIMAGPAVGTNFPGTGRIEICAKSPLTGMWGEASMGGHFAPALKWAGYDGIVAFGKCEKPSYLLITDEKAEILSAKHLWGSDTYETERSLKEKYGKKARVMSIGPAGENLVRYASIVNDRGSLAGRTGMGAVMGSKNLKAVVVIGTQKVKIAHPERAKAARQKILKNIKADFGAEGLKAFGSNVHMEMGMAISDVPVKNWREGLWADGMKKISGPAVSEKILTKTKSCYSCPISCKRIIKVEKGPYATEEVPGPEYEAAASLGTLLKIDNLDAVAKMNDICDRAGFDVISAGSSIAYAIEAYEKGLIKKKDTGGLVLKWGDADTAIKLLKQIAEMKGIGEHLGLGSREMSRRFGGEEFAIHVKGLEAPMHDPRALWGLALSYATGVRGACHVNDVTLAVELGLHTYREAGMKPTKPGSSKGKAYSAIVSQRIGQVLSSAVICEYVFWAMGDTRELAEMLKCVTGFDYTVDELMEIGDRIWYLKRAFANMCGIRKEDDSLPVRIIVPHEEGYGKNSAGAVVYNINKLTVAALGLPFMKNEKVLKHAKTLADKALFPNLYTIISMTAAVNPQIRLRDWRYRRAELEEIRRRSVDFDLMIKDFYRLRELGDKGIPDRVRLESLELHDVAETLESIR